MSGAAAVLGTRVSAPQPQSQPQRRRGKGGLQSRKRRRRRAALARAKDAENSRPPLPEAPREADGEQPKQEMDRSMWAPRDEPCMSEAVERVLDAGDQETPVLIIDVDRVADNYRSLKEALPLANIYYAVKANPEARVLRELARLGSCFDVASPGEIDMALAAGATPDRISFGNTIKKESAIVYAYSRGIRLYAFDSDAELEKLARSAPGARVFCRVLAPEDPGAEWPLSKKFGCYPRMAERLLLRARELGMDACGVSFHVGSQMNNTGAWRNALAEVATIFKHVPGLTLVNLGGGMPAQYTRAIPAISEYGRRIMAGVHEFFGDDDSKLPSLIVEPGRGMVGNAGVIESEVVLVSKKSDDEDAERWVYLDIGLFGGLAETMGESIKYRVRCGGRNSQLGRVVLAGPTCDSADVMYQHTEFNMPIELEAGDRVHILTTGAYTTTYSAVAFNGFAPLRAICVGGGGDGAADGEGDADRAPR